MPSATQILENYLAGKNLRMTGQRQQVLRTFLSTERHLSAEDLHTLVKKKAPSIGYSTVSRMLKILCACGLAQEIELGDGRARFEHAFAHRHHDHLICVRCGRSVEVMSPKLEQVQMQVARRNKFKPQWHRLQIFGICHSCRKG